MLTLILILAVVAPPSGRVMTFTPGRGIGACEYNVETAGPVRRPPSLIQNTVISRKIGNKDDGIRGSSWADEIERLHGPAAYRLKPKRGCDAVHLVVYADGPAAADLDRISNVTRIDVSRCGVTDPEDATEKVNRNLALPSGVTTVFALMRRSDGFYESVRNHHWQGEVADLLSANAKPCPPPMPSWPPAPPLGR